MASLWLSGSWAADRRLTADQFVPCRIFSTRETLKRLQAACAKLGNPELADKSFGESHAASIMAKEKNGWKPTLANFIQDIQKACVEHGRGEGMWNAMCYDPTEVISIDM